jgi:hypothetical protein
LSVGVLLFAGEVEELPVIGLGLFAVFQQIGVWTNERYWALLAVETVSRAKISIVNALCIMKTRFISL